jgi:hypothetical protein
MPDFPVESIFLLQRYFLVVRVQTHIRVRPRLHCGRRPDRPLRAARPSGSRRSGIRRRLGRHHRVLHRQAREFLEEPAACWLVLNAQARTQSPRDIPGELRAVL